MIDSFDRIDVLAKLLKFADHLAELAEDDKQFITQMLEYYEEQKTLPCLDILRIVQMQVPGEEPSAPPRLQEGTVSVERKYLNEVIWRYMPLEVLFSLLSIEKLHFSPLCQMLDKTEGGLPPRAFELTKAKLAKHLHKSTEGITPDRIVQSLIEQRQETISLSCWYMSETDSLEMWRNYAPRNGVAIRTTVQRLYSSLRKRNDTNIHLSPVTYYEAEEEDMYIEEAFFGSLYIKHAEPYRAEKELRALAPGGIYKYGIDIPVDVGLLIERLMLSPDLKPWAVPYLIEAIRKFGLECQIEQSSLTV